MVGPPPNKADYLCPSPHFTHQQAEMHIKDCEEKIDSPIFLTSICVAEIRALSKNKNLQGDGG